ncbi:hypothetical protein C1646_676601 [Rhizophagus diaphanus]|nr:hypothetical protein C1646_676601 [Rhizophagus diaphanus] [Rhizophagus sp. MUCL 43196]
MTLQNRLYLKLADRLSVCKYIISCSIHKLISASEGAGLNIKPDFKRRFLTIRREIWLLVSSGSSNAWHTRWRQLGLESDNYDFWQTVLEHVSDIENDLFKSYCEKILLDSSLFKFYETTFDYFYFDWIESHARAAKMIKSATFSVIVRVDAKATRHSDELDVWHMEGAGGCLIVCGLFYHFFQCNIRYIEGITKVNSFKEDEIKKQETLMEENNYCGLQSKEMTVHLGVNDT